jgi:hypothetical protein
MRDRTGITGHVTAKLWRPNAVGVFELVEVHEADNLVTEYGDEFYGEKAHGLGSHSAVTGMRLGTGSTAAAKTGAGAAIVTHLTGSNKALDGAIGSALVGAARQMEFVTTWNPGEATHAAIAEVVLTNLSPIGTGGGSAADTLSRVVFSSTINKAGGDSLEVTWTHDLLGT